MKLRPLKLQDAPLMLAWMHDESVVGHLGTNFMEKTLADCENFIRWAREADTDLHLAVTDDQDEYMGTVSLKHIDKAAGTAEFAITVRKEAMGKGYSAWGMQAILDRGKNMGIPNIYWCVSRDNLRAVRFYDKNGYTRVTSVPESISGCYTPAQLDNFIWYLY